MAVEPTPTGADLRRVINLGQIVQSNALIFFHLSSPDLLFGFDADPADAQHLRRRAQTNPALARDGIGAAQVGPADHRVAGRQADPPRRGSCPGGVAVPLTAEVRDRILAGVPEAIAAVERAIAWYKSRHDPLGGGGRHRSATSGPRSWASSTARATSTTTAAGSGSWTPTATSSPTGSTRSSSTTTSARPSSRGRTSSRPTGSRWATRTASTASGRWRGSTWPTGWARRAPTRSSRSSAGAWAASPARPSTTTTRGSSTRSTPSRRSRSCCAGPDILVNARALRRRHQPQRGHRRLRGAARHAHAPLQGGRRRPRRSGRTWSSPPGHNNMAMNRAVLQVARHYVKGDTARRADAQPGRGGHPLLRPVPVLLDPRPRPDGAPASSCWRPDGDGPGRAGPVTTPARDGRHLVTSRPDGPVRRARHRATATRCAPTTASAGTRPRLLAGDPRLAGVDRRCRAPADAGAGVRR